MEPEPVTPSDSRTRASQHDDPSGKFRLIRNPVWLVSFVLFFSLSAVWAISSPLFSVPDEPAHVVKAASLVRGELVPDKRELPDEGRGFFRGGFTTEVHVPLSYTWNTITIGGCHMFDTRIPAGCSPAFVDDPRPATWTTWVGRYQPTVYALIGWATLVDTGSKSIYLMRFLQGALSAALLATAFACAASARRLRLVVLGVALAATPQVFFLAGGVNPNGLEATAAICSWTVLAVIAFDGRRPVPRHLILAFGVSAALLAWTRPLSVLWLAVAVVVMGVAAGRRRWTEVLRARSARITAAAVGVLAVGSLCWTLAFDALGNNDGDDPRGLGLLPAFWHALGRSGEYLEQMVGVFGWRLTTMPTPTYWLWALPIVALIWLAIRHAPPRQRIAVLLVAGGAVLAPAFIQAPTADEIGFAWSGRLGLPLAVGLPILATAVVASSARLTPRNRSRLAVVIGSVIAFVQVAAHVVSTRRYVVGTDGPLFYLDQHGWDPPLPAWLLLVVTVTVAVALAIFTYRVASIEPALGLDGRADDDAVHPVMSPSPQIDTA